MRGAVVDIIRCECVSKALSRDSRRAGETQFELLLPDADAGEVIPSVESDRHSVETVSASEIDVILGFQAIECYTDRCPQLRSSSFTVRSKFLIYIPRSQNYSTTTILIPAPNPDHWPSGNS